MTIKHIQDQIENLALSIAISAYNMGVQHQKHEGELPEFDDLQDQLLEIIKTKMKGEY